MKTTILTLGIALIPSLGASAQTTTDPKPVDAYQSDHHRCIMASTETWQNFGVNPVQMAMVRDVQIACKADYEASKPDEAAASVDKHEAKLKDILPPDQYMKWSQWCAQEAAAKPQTGTTK